MPYAVQWLQNLILTRPLDAPESRLDARLLQGGAWGVLLALPLLLWQFGGQGLLPVSTSGYLPFHSLAEGFAVLVAMMIFVTGWHVHDGHHRGASVLLACAFLAVGLIDFAHLLSHPGMSDFITPNGPGKTVAFWLSERMTLSLAVLCYVLLPRRGECLIAHRHLVLAVALGWAGLCWWLGITQAEALAALLGAADGPSRIESAVEATSILLIVAALFGLGRQAPGDTRQQRPTIALACWLMLASQLFFLADAPGADLSAVLGHLYKIAGYFFLYRGMFVESVQAPIQRLHQAKAELDESRQHYLQLLEAAPDAIVVADADGRILLGNQALEQLFGHDRSELLGQPVETLLPQALRRAHAERRSAYATHPTPRPMQNLPNLVGQHKDGRELPVDISLSVVRGARGTQYLAFVRDAADRRRLESALRHQAGHDALTDLPNRTVLHQRIEEALAAPRQDGRGVALLLLDLDNFKNINDSLGHHVGDAFLVETARRLQAAARDGEMAARLGGDEFVLLLPAAEGLAQAEATARRVLAMLAPPVAVDGYELAGGVSVGIAWAADGADKDDGTLLRQADIAMYQAKAHARGSYRVFSDDMQARLDDDLLLRQRLARAIELGQLELHYQPQVSVASGAVLGVEALLRWTHPTLGPISPARFIPVAEASGLILPLGEWVLREACRQVAAWCAAGTPVLVSVNLSAHQFRLNDLVERVSAALRDAGAPPELLELELTETAVMQDPQTAAAVLAQLAALGVSLAIDDFGTGYSSLSRLTTFKLHKLKIDRAFVDDMCHSAGDAAIVRATVSLAHSLGLTVVAEGVETQEQLAFLDDVGCEQYQGWLFSRARPAGELAPLLLRQRPAQPVAAASAAVPEAALA
ncbi:bifunctional diguanylate cyclase/phosphodiesterase [Eleftheria terrae]|uniref:bifunctional diguanylate cyclase/phosphodiesterase n=1 Tax=Eleftheria terrae TaxID=1597781 RepID=UPI00263AFAC3|nr:EAL domain-containing protein [Eleftheria terrae]WKB54803.1 EAL domain-containing protein [Eleftheria terrae]